MVFLPTKLSRFLSPSRGLRVDPKPPVKMPQSLLKCSLRRCGQGLALLSLKWPPQKHSWPTEGLCFGEGAALPSHLHILTPIVSRGPARALREKSSGQHGHPDIVKPQTASACSWVARQELPGRSYTPRHWAVVHGHHQENSVNHTRESSPYSRGEFNPALEGTAPKNLWTLTLPQKTRRQGG